MRTLLIHAYVPLSFWHHALQMATYLHNILPSKLLANESPFKILYQKDPSDSHIRVFGCLCYPLFPSTTINKLQARSTPCVFFGYSSNHRGYKWFDLSSNKIITSQHVSFDENIFPFARMHEPKPITYDFLDSGFSPSTIHYLQHQSSQSPTIEPTQRDQPTTPLSPTSETTTPHSHTPIPMTQSSPNLPTPPRPHAGPVPQPTQIQPHPSLIHGPVTRNQHGIHKPNPRYKPDPAHNTTITKSPLPCNPIASLNDQNWKLAMDDEFNALIKNKTSDLVPCPPVVNIIQSMWILTHKEKSDGSFEQHKARLIGDGKTQQVDVDCGKTFWIVLSLSLSKNWPIHQLDVKNAFLHGELKETVYMHQPMGFRDYV